MAGVRVSRQWLESLNVQENVISHVCSIVATSSFKGASVKDIMPTIEGKIVQDADRLDAIGAIGIARVFAYGGNRNREIYNPKVKSQTNQTSKQYKTNNNPSINHFYEKLLLLKNRMNTNTGKLIAEKRHKFMEDYLERFYQEWDGSDLITDHQALKEYSLASK